MAHQKRNGVLRRLLPCFMGMSMVSIATAAWGQSDQQLREIVLSNGLEPLKPFERVDPAVFELGRSLYFDKELSGNRDMACATCHQPSLATGDAKSLSVGTMGEGLGDSRTPGTDRDFIPRNAPDIFERGVPGWTSMFWDSRVAQNSDGTLVTPAGEKLPAGVRSLLGAQAMFPVTSDAEMRGSKGDLDIHGQVNELALIEESDLPAIWDAIAARLMNIGGYVEMFQKAYPDTPVEDLGFEHAGEAIGAFEAQAFTFADSPWDKYLAGDDNAMTESAKRGALLFHGSGNCASCHSGDLFTDQQHHNIGIPQLGPGKADPVTNLDLGRSLVSGEAEDDFAFRTPSLRNTAITGPWMHDGAFASLEQAVSHYSDRSQALASYDPAQLEELLQDRVHMDADTLARMEVTLSNQGVVTEPLTPEEVQDLLAFLGSLTTTSLMKLEDTIPDQVPSGLAVDRITSEFDEVTVLYDSTTGKLAMEGPAGVQLDAMAMEIHEGADGTLAEFIFNTDAAPWEAESVFYAEDGETLQEFQSLVGVLGDFTLGTDDVLGQLLPSGLTQVDLDEHLSVRISVLGMPGTAMPHIVAIPEPSTLVLALLALLFGAAPYCKRNGSRFL